MGKNKGKFVDLHKMQVEKLKQRDLFLDTLRPDTCGGCRFLYYYKSHDNEAWCVLWNEDKDWKEQSCQSGIKKNTRNNI